MAKIKNIEILRMESYNLQPKNKEKKSKVKVNLSTIIAIPLLLVASHYVGYAQGKAEDYLRWRYENIQRCSGGEETGLFGKLTKEAAMIQVYRHRDTTTINNIGGNQENQTNQEQINPNVHLL